MQQTRTDQPALDVPPGRPPAVRAIGLGRGFGPVRAVDGVDLDVPMGAVLGLLGPNGAGKTTLLRMLLGLLAPTEGAVELLGRRLPGRAAEVLPHVGAMIEGPAVHPHRTGRQNLLRYAAAEPLLDTARIPAAVDAVLRRTGLADVADRRVHGYSLGMRQRLGLAVPMLTRRRLVVLDEPTNGLDPAGTRDVRRLITEMNTAGATVVISSHLLAEVEATCSHVAVLHRGRLVTAGPLRDLLADGPGTLLVTTPDGGRAVRALQARGIDAEQGPYARVHVASGPAAPEVVALLVHSGVAVQEVARPSARLEEVFARLTGDPVPGGPPDAAAPMAHAHAHTDPAWAPPYGAAHADPAWAPPYGAPR
ncbi:ABC transporter ATP-binding protein [Pseudonocardia parietis]|uniref:ABC-2 type transport system ATP-binding protein n=1 Tax=Pseudonocardia parietis TaxID=570936 RepID=A0ABS4W3R4_9PSEU|nr:ABC transporter ATP-binding protein [Pseudonocardia parietis]MBP2370847.1 ABC-2 type transport system ATP-binding protein [Pseudonocardia parietis]